MHRKISEVVGWLGVILVLIAYLLVTEKILIVGPLYLLLNIVGSLALIYVAVFQKARQSLIINIIWVAISVVSLVKGH